MEKSSENIKGKPNIHRSELYKLLEIDAWAGKHLVEQVCFIWKIKRNNDYSKHKKPKP